MPWTNVLPRPSVTATPPVVCRLEFLRTSANRSQRRQVKVHHGDITIAGFSGNFLRKQLGFLSITIGHYDLVALAGKIHCRYAANAVGSAGYENRFHMKLVR
jgi:hypothetical protein